MAKKERGKAQKEKREDFYGWRQGVLGLMSPINGFSVVDDIALRDVYSNRKYSRIVLMRFILNFKK